MRLFFYDAKILEYLRSHAVHQFICTGLNASYVGNTQHPSKLGSISKRTIKLEGDTTDCL